MNILTKGQKIGIFIFMGIVVLMFVSSYVSDTIYCESVEFNDEIDSVIHSNRSFKVITKTKTHSFSPTNYSGLEDFLQAGDSIYKNKGNCTITIIRNITDTTIRRKFEWYTFLISDFENHYEERVGSK